MILELVEFDTPKGWGREQVMDDARKVFAKWQANADLKRKHFLLDETGKTIAGVYIWPSIEAAKRAHNAEWQQSVVQRTGGAARIRYFDLLALVDNEAGKVTEFAENPFEPAVS
ncbi:hypothetical protein [Pseudolabrys sp. FHR47]|uniref:hypothetical protein n=1 Tax=Pseudolabrys sp. FHR47 TaxID=2562284 RepID=UPI0010BE6379|nr:hypothetical protein [Pseudolabrys sp. FHR47]